MCHLHLQSDLRHLLPLVKNCDGDRLNYRTSVGKNCRSPQELLTSTFSKVGVILQQKYAILLLRRLILVQFELLCVSLELIEDVLYSYKELKNIVEGIDEFNGCCSAHSPSEEGLTIELADLTELYINTHAKWLSSTLSKAPPLERVIELVQFESSFSRTFLSLLATCTSMLNVGTSRKVKRKEYVSEEVLSIQMSDEHVKWSDYLVPGAQSETLRITCKDVFNELWNRVAGNLVEQTKLSFQGDWVLTEYVPWLANASQLSGLESFPVVIDCLKHVSASCLKQHHVIEWDKAFQRLLVSTITKYHKGYRISNANSKTFAFSEAFEILNRSLTEHVEEVAHISKDSSKSIVAHVHALKHNLLLSSLLNVTVKHMAFVLVQNVGTSMSLWDLNALGWVLFVEVPLAKKTLNTSATIGYRAFSPRVSFPQYSSLHSLEIATRKSCSTLHATSMHLQETFESFYGSFQTTWTAKCSEIFKAGFPSPKLWKNTKKQGSLDHNTYCDDVVSDLLLPVVEAAVILPAPQQTNFTFLMTTVLFCEYRKTILSNKKLYTYFAGRQLLTDYRTILRWLTSNDLHLDKTTLQLLSQAPLLTEIEKGLLTVCGVEDNEKQEDEAELIKDLNISLPSRNFPVIYEMAWNKPDDWLKCMY